MIIHKIMLLFLGIIFSLSALEIPANHKHEACKINDWVINCQFTEALTHVDSLIAAEPTVPLFPVMKVSILGLRDLDLGTAADSALFRKSYESAHHSIKQYEDKNGKDSYSMTMIGFADAMFATYYVHHSQYFSAIDLGMDAIRLFRKVKKIDSQNYDVDFFLGFYNYARGELKKKLWMVLFWQFGKKDKGISSLEICSSRGSILNDPAKMILADVYVQEEMFHKYEKLIVNLENKYPQSRFLMWSRARFYEKKEKYLQAAEVYKKLSNYYKDVFKGEQNHLKTCLKQLEMLEKSKTHEDTLSHIAQATLDEPYRGEERSIKKLRKKIRKYTED